MAQLYGVDISEFNPVSSWDTLNTVTNFVIIRSCFGTARKDYKFDQNKSEAHRVQAAAGPLGVGYYHYAYPQYAANTPVAEADFFVNNVSPLSKGDILCLDWEEPYSGDHAAWCLAFLNRVQARTGVKPLIYLNQSLMNGHNWTSVINAGYGLWLAKYDGSQTAGPGPSPWPVVAMRQWTSSATIAGIAGNVDADVFYGDWAALAAYGFQYVPPITPAPSSTTTTLPPVTQTTTTTVPPVPPLPTVPNYDKENNDLLKQILTIVQQIKDKILSVFK